MMDHIRHTIGELLARVPVDSHQLGDPVQMEDRIEALEERVSLLIARGDKLEQEHERLESQ